VVARFITFEGGEGTGKSTQALLLAEALRERGESVIQTREPGGSEGAELIRALLVSGDTNRWSAMSEVLLLFAARIDHWEKVIKPALDQGKWVICDRFTDSTIAYQGYGRGVDLSFLSLLSNTVLGECIPNRTFLFDLDPAIGVQRALSRHTSETRFEKMDLSFHQRLREGFLEIARKNPNRCRVISALDTVQNIHQKILEELGIS
jgi:dTMP kinase